MTFTTKQWIFLALCDGGVILIGAMVGLYLSEEIPFTLCAVMCLVGGVMLVASLIFMHLKMRCSSCHHIYPLVGWWGMECCPYCGEYFY